MFAMARYKEHARIAVGRLATMLAIAAVSACTTGDVFSLQPAVDVGSQTAAVPAAAPEYQGMQRLVPSNPYMTAAYPRMDEPMSPLEQMPASEVDCRSELKRLRVAYTDLAPIHEGQCGIDYPVKVSAIGSIQMKPAATLTCDMAATFAGWTKNELVPSARWRYFSGVKTIHQGSSYSCRNIAGEGVLSEHGKGNALDVMSIELNNGDDIDVRKPGLFAFRTRGFLNTVRADGCQYFTTVLGPGYNYDHRNHFHFDIKNRKSGYRACR
ncbi:extensin family protein [Mesorhizobium amorphae]|uniref:Extensin family protein n=1 Tax=Mesorhizobium amorphae CCNWGS0123 TaxID=1082933 RepID=G6YAJ3_9HYPH|nr:Extensin family protein [Mesorhizobium amorphae CCNWGS0123]